VSAPPYTLLFSDEASKVLDDLLRSSHYATKCKKIRKALQLLRDEGPMYPGLQSHKYKTMRGPNGEDVWESYVENKTPGAWRIWWCYGPETETITVYTIGKHPD
jgi:hypothetical protein